MCGIFCVFSKSEINITEKLSKTFQEFNLNISRRGPNQSKIEICHSDDQIFLFAASVLWLQGSKPTKQPIDEIDHLLVYNGDIFDDENENSRNAYGDTKLFLEFFKSEKSLESLFHSNGPFAFICLDKRNSTLYFGRDKYGRRSLLIGISETEIVLTSVAKKNTNFKFIEVPSLGLFGFNFREKKFTLKPWYKHNHNFAHKFQEYSKFLGKNIVLDEAITNSSIPIDFIEPSEDDLRFLTNLKYLACGNVFDAISTSFELSNKIKELKNHLENAIAKRISNQPKFCRDCIREQSSCNHCFVGVLFSGGVDCAILALLAHKFVPKDRPIDLLNVAFSKDDFSTPDRVTGLKTVKELSMLCPDRQWNFVEINVSFEELDKERNSRIADLIYPLNTILDDSLGCALWFASRGISKSYMSPCRSLLVGMGADELFGGYSRHRASFKNESWIGLHKVLKEDWENLPYRNLGRDDRVVSDHGRQLRTPYLDEDVVQYVQRLHCWEKSWPTDELPQEVGPKYLLRALAHQLGLQSAAGFKKRALQFGSRIANSKENAHEISPRL